MASKQHITKLRTFAETNDTWILLRDDFGKKPTMLFKYPPGSWNIAEDQVGIGDTNASHPPYVFWVLNDAAQWGIGEQSDDTLQVTGPVQWRILSFESEEEIDAKMKQLQQA
ncbi:hypothetical protein BEP19_10680 [Ammoniphilus oxalaticus]|uniref:Uncharacterized protein n=1 Tax=Ammoniphilus oxalaticus TaxID=66863 RepID=A0A419SFZ9_9BACL|nr:hypothetical protein [Ammoniphilus oxalaticus]RKD22713.1 hypothetical protein BEP19_10680 [Ammoniphilus oxalaticus]